MRNKAVTASIFLALLIGVVGCKNTCNSAILNNDANTNKQAQNLREPIYLVLNESLWANCDISIRAFSTCRENVKVVIKAGVNDWLKHFYEPYRPKVMIVLSQKDVPAKMVNKTVYISMDKKGCIFKDKNDQPETNHPACFFSEADYFKIIFKEPNAITIPTAAHEFGHTLGLSHPDDKDIFSIMSPEGKGDMVLPIDMITLCKLHSECPLHDETWCEDTFYDSCRCPSKSFGDGEAKRVEEELVCK